MKPVELRVDGFTSFRQQARIDFRTFDLFAISGSTGAGKTSLLDAIIFALYGRTPRLGADYRSLLSQGAQRMTVLFQFQAGGKDFQVVRSLKRGANLQVRLAELVDGQWSSLADSVRSVDQQVERIIGLDFDGFTRAVVLPQGAFDQFLRGDKAKRREILTDLLQLNVYVEMARRANAKSSTAGEQAQVQEALVRDHFANATEESLRSARECLNTRRRQSEEMQIRARAVDAALQVARRIRAHRDHAQGEMDLEKQASSAAAGASARVAVLESRRANVAAAVEHAQAGLTANVFDESRYMELHRLEDAVRQAEQLRSSHRSAQLAVQRASEQARLARRQLEVSAGARDRARNTAAEAAQLSIAAQQSYDAGVQRYGSPDALLRAAADLEKLPIYENEIAGIGRQLADIRSAHSRDTAAMGELRSKHEGALAEILRLEALLEHLQREHSATDLRRKLKKGEPCPVCEQIVDKLPKPAGTPRTIDQEKKKLAAARSQEQAARQNLAQCETRVQTYPRQIAVLESSQGNLEQQIRDLADRRPDDGTDLRSVAAELRQRESECRTLRARSEEAQRALMALEKEASQSETRVKLVDQQCKQLEAELTRHRVELDALEPHLNNWSAEDYALQQHAKAERERMEQELNRLRPDLHRLELELSSVEHTQRMAMQQQQAHRAAADLALASARDLATELRRTVDIPANADESGFLESARAALEKQRQQISHETGSLEEQIAVLEKDIRKAEQLRTRAAELKRTAEMYRDVGLTLRGDKFIEFLLGHAMENLAQEGSKHLERLSAGRYSFVPTDGSFSVVDQWNADDVRPVATLSGGESFLASLALALALSSTISQLSAGGGRFTLDSLFLDEGFSSLDPETLDTVVSAIESLSGGERMVGVISHLPELAMRLPVQVHVHKSIGGSTVEVRASGG